MSWQLQLCVSVFLFTSVKCAAICPIGFKCCSDIWCDPGKEAICSLANDGAICRVCRNTTFQPDRTPLGTRCRTKRLCNKMNMIYISHGSSLSDAICGCELGYHMVPDLDECIPNEKCENGHGIDQKGGCVPCKEGTYSDTIDGFQICQPITDCRREGRCIVSPGSSTANAVCGEKFHDIKSCLRPTEMTYTNNISTALPPTTTDKEIITAKVPHQKERSKDPTLYIITAISVALFMLFAFGLCIAILLCRELKRRPSLDEFLGRSQTNRNGNLYLHEFKQRCSDQAFNATALEELGNHVPQLVGKHHVSFGRCLLGKAGYEPNTIDPILDDIMHRCNSSGACSIPEYITNYIHKWKSLKTEVNATASDIIEVLLEINCATDFAVDFMKRHLQGSTVGQQREYTSEEEIPLRGQGYSDLGDSNASEVAVAIDGPTNEETELKTT